MDNETTRTVINFDNEWKFSKLAQKNELSGIKVEASDFDDLGQHRTTPRKANSV